MHSLNVVFNPDFSLDESKAKKIWNFVKGDIAKLLSAIEYDTNIQVSVLDDKSYLVDHQPNNQCNKLKIGHDLQFANGLEIKENEIAFPALILAILIRLQRTYKKAFKVTCNHYPIVARANQMLQEVLNIKTSHNWLGGFIEYPMPGRKPVKEKPLTTKEVSQRYTAKRQAQGEVQLKTWIHRDVKNQLDVYCQLKGCKLEEALAEIIPLGLNIGTYLNKKNE